MSRAHAIPTLLLLLLSCASSAANDLLPAPEDLHISSPVLGKMAVTWKHVEAPENNSVEYWVQRSEPCAPDCQKFTKKNSTSFRLLSPHPRVRVRVATILKTMLDKVKEDDHNWTIKYLPPSRGEEGTAAEQLQCIIFRSAQKEALLSCDWLPGQKAPSDTQYHFYYRWTETVGRCPQYVTEAGGQRHSGCRVPLQDVPTELFILVNGSSARREIKATERIIQTNQIEEIPPVHNFSLTSGRLSWDRPVLTLAPTCFVYEVNFWSRDENLTERWVGLSPPDVVTVDGTSYWHEDLEEPASKMYVRVRWIGKDPCWSPSRRLGPWSEVIAIEGKKGDKLWITLSISLLMVCLALFILCIRCWRSLFPQIPKPKDDLKEAFKNTQSQALMRCNSWDTEEVISYLEVMTTPNNPHKLPLDYSIISD